MEIIPVIAVLGLGAVGFFLMLTAFALSAAHDPRQPVVSWPLPRRLLFAGAILAMLSCMLLMLPGVIPWWDYSDPMQVWIQGVFVGFALGILYWRWAGPKMMQKRAGERVQS
jgi:hypothetical protein